MDDVFDFERLTVYQKALDFVDKIYSVTDGFPSEERFSLTDQFRRAAVSISLNIAEGSAGSKAEFKQYLKISKRSSRECVAITEIANRRGYITDLDKESLRKNIIELSKMLNGLSKSMDRGEVVQSS